LSAPGITLLPWLLWSEPRLFWLLLVPDAFEPLSGVVAAVLESGVRLEFWLLWPVSEVRSGSELLMELRPGISPVTVLRPGRTLVIVLELAELLVCSAVSCKFCFAEFVSCEFVSGEAGQDSPVTPATAEFTWAAIGRPARLQASPVTWDPVTVWATGVSGEVWARAGAAAPATRMVAEATPPRKTCHLYTERSRFESWIGIGRDREAERPEPDTGGPGERPACAPEMVN
jgi:hypothetical protein